MPAWRLLIHEPQPPALALAVDEAIAMQCAKSRLATLRLYQWDRPAISIGRFQRIDGAVRAERCRSAGIPVLRRITGGRAVWHDRELTYSLVSPLPSPLFPASLTETVAVIGRVLAGGLQALGLPAQLSAVAFPATRRADARPSPFCFDAPARHEVCAGGKKLIGSAQRRWRDRFLQQGSILLRHDAGAVARWLPVHSDDLQTAAGLNDLLPEPVEADRVAEQLARHVASAWKIALQPGDLTAEETALAGALVREKYETVAWTMRGEGKQPVTG